LVSCGSADIKGKNVIMAIAKGSVTENDNYVSNSHAQVRSKKKII
jgi:hypothetical protein